MDHLVKLLIVFFAVVTNVALATPQGSFEKPLKLASGREYGLVHYCPPSHFALGICASGADFSCDDKSSGFTTSCMTSETLFKHSGTPEWKFTDAGEWVSCGEGVVLAVCTSGNREQCYSRDEAGDLKLNAQGILCSKPDPVSTTDTKVFTDEAEEDCYHTCRRSGSEFTCGEGYALHGICSSLEVGSCDSDDKCPQSANVMFGVSCCKLRKDAVQPVEEEPDNTVLIVAVTAVGSACIGAGIVAGRRKFSQPSSKSKGFRHGGIASMAAPTSAKSSNLMNNDRIVSPKLSDMDNYQGTVDAGKGTKGGFWKGISFFGKQPERSGSYDTTAASQNSNAEGNPNAILNYLSKTTTSDLFIDPDDLEIGPLITKGGEGQVFQGRFAGSAVAVKEILNSTDTLSDAFRREFESLRLIQHPHIIRLFGICAKRSVDTGMTRYLIVMEMAKCSLRKIIRERQAVDYNQAIDLAYQTCVGIAFIHSQNMLHLDIKPENVLLSSSGTIKICDLGLATIATSRSSVGHAQKTVTGHGVTGTPAYIAPERVHDFKKVAEGTKRRISSASDVYSFGIMLWELCHIERPYPKEWDGYKIIAEVKVRDYRPKISPQCPQQLAEIITACWSRDPKLRPTFSSLKIRFKEIRAQSSSKGKRRSDILSNFSRIFARSPEASHAHQPEVPAHLRHSGDPRFDQRQPYAQSPQYMNEYPRDKAPDHDELMQYL